MTTVAFGSWPVGTSTSRTVILTNNQSVPLTINGISASGDFTGTSTCPVAPNTLSANATCQIVVTFTATTLGLRTGTLTVNDNGTTSPQTAQLSGTGVVPVGLSNYSWSFGNQSVNTTSSAKSITLLNYQAIPLTISEISTSGDFAQTSNCPVSPSTLAARGTCTISITFTPTAVGTRPGVLTVNDDASNSPQSTTLAGTGIVPVALYNPSLSFYGQVVTTTSVPKTITLKNNQSGPLTILGISTSGDFAQTSNCPASPNTLAGGSSCTISVTFTPTAMGNRAGTLTVSDDANTSPQTATLSGTGTLSGLSAISVTPLGPVLPIGSVQQFTAMGTFPNSQTVDISSFVHWSTSVPAVAQVNSTGSVEALAEGTTTITASYGTVVGQTLFTVGSAVLTSITVTPANSSQPVGSYQQFTAVLNYGDGSTKESTSAVSWSSSLPGAAAINSSGLARASAAGKTTIQATLGSVVGRTTLTVSSPSCAAPPAGLVGWWTGDGNTVDIGGQHSGVLQNGAGYSSGEVGQAFAFGGGGASILINGPVYSPLAGTLTFWFLPTGAPGALTGSYAGAQNRAPGFLIDSAGNLNWEFGNLYAQSLGQVSPNQWTHVAMTYSTSNSQTAISVYLNGVLVADAVADANNSWNPQVAFGTYLGATQPSFAGSMDEIAIFNQALTSAQIQQIYGAFSAGMCKPKLQSIAVTPASPTLSPGLTMMFDAVGSYSDGTTHDVTTSAKWSTTNPAAATISASGLATAVASGNTIVLAALGSVGGATKLVVAPGLASVQVTPQNPSLAAGTMQPFKAIGTFTNGSQQDLTTSVAWASSTPAVATIGSSGIATSVAAGQTTITATAGSVSGSSLLGVTSAELSSITVSPAGATIVTGTTQSFSATGTFSDGSQQDVTASASWTSSAPAIATVSSNGTVTGLSAGQVTITATVGSVASTANLTVTTANLATIQVSPQSPSVVIGSAQQFSATAIYSDGSSVDISANATWTSSAATVATMSNSPQGLAVSTGTGATRISASYGGLAASTTLTVQDQLSSIAIVPSTFSVAIGSTRQFLATGTYASGIQEDLTASVTWSSSAPAVAGISSSGVATGLTSGQTNISGSLGSLTASATLTVVSPSVIGRWSAVSNTMPINPIHVGLLSNGELLVIAGSGNCPASHPGCPAGPPYGPSNGSGALLWDPVNEQTVNQFSVSWDLFCNGMALLPDGRALIDGGTLQYDPFYGTAQATIFDPATNTFNDIQNTAHGRWYPTLLTLGDGTTMTFSGLTETGGTNSAVEFYTAASGWSTQYIAPWSPDLYPRLHLLPNGTVFYSGAQTVSKLFDPSTASWNINVASTNFSGMRVYGTSVLLPLTPANGYDPKVMIMGGGNPATSTTEIIDMGSATPAWQYGPNMSQGRVQMNAVILPNGEVLALGGSVNYEDTTTASLNADLYDPVSNTFSSAGANAYPRLYHSVALLLPDATVWVAGGNPTRGAYVQQIEIYQPAYLFNPDGSMATRPSITGAPSSISYGNTFTVTTPDSANISSVALVRNGTVTHAFGMDQREVGLSFAAGSGTLSVTAPPNGNIAPPGYYMLFILNNSGVPSLATFVQLTADGSQSSALNRLSSAMNTLEQVPSPALNPGHAGPRASHTMSPVDTRNKQSTSTVGSSSKASIDITGTWSGTFFSKHSNVVPFSITVIVSPDSRGNLVGTSTLNSDCLKDAKLQVSFTDSNIVLAGSDEQGDNLTVRATLDKTGTLMRSSYILDGSATGRCETDDGTGTLAKR